MRAFAIAIVIGLALTLAAVVSGHGAIVGIYDPVPIHVNA